MIATCKMAIIAAALVGLLSSCHGSRFYDDNDDNNPQPLNQRQLRRPAFSWVYQG